MQKKMDNTMEISRRRLNRGKKGQTATWGLSFRAQGFGLKVGGLELRI